MAAKTNDERRRVLRAIGPVWDGNEVWLLAAGGALYFAFPRLYASSFSGFYLPLTMILWLLILRGVGIEFRAHIKNRVWQDFFDVIFSLSSILLAVFFGAALGNVVRGVPLDSTGSFFEPLWTSFKLGPLTGILDWYTVLIGVVALVTLAAHGSYYIALKTDGDLGRRARGFALLCWPVQFFLTCISLVAPYFIRPELMPHYWKPKIRILISLSPGVSFAFTFRDRHDGTIFCSKIRPTTLGLGKPLSPPINLNSSAHSPHPAPQQPTPQPLTGVNTLIAVGSGKGGVGKTTLSV